MRSARKLLFAGLGVVLLLLSQTATTFADITVGSTTTVVVPPRSSDYSIAISSDQSGNLPENTTITYTLTYGALASSGFATDDTITADFSQDTAPGGIDVTDYVVGSASKAYNNTSPVVDLLNRKITWTISQLPPGTTNQIVTFQLRTNLNYTGSNTIPITVTGKFSNQYVTLSPVSVTNDYQYDPSLAPTPTPTITPTPQPTATPTPGGPSNSSTKSTPTPTLPIATPTPTPLVQNPQITAFTFTQITDNAMTLSMTTDQKTRLSAFYGLSPKTLSSQVFDDKYQTTHTLTLTNLLPNTPYYIQLTMINDVGLDTTSEILTFKTALPSTPPVISQNNITIISNNAFVPTTTSPQQNSVVLLPQTQEYSIALRVQVTTRIRRIVALVRNRRVLAANTFSQEPTDSVYAASMTETQPGLYTANLTTPSIPGVYDVFAQIIDDNGNISETQISEIVVYGPIHVIDKNSSQPIQHARIFLSLFDTGKNAYEPIVSSNTQINPLYTDTNGLTRITQGAGKYRIEVSQYGYQTQIREFVLDDHHLTPPEIRLIPTGFDIVTFTQDFIQSGHDIGIQLFADIQNLSNSYRFFRLLAASIVSCLIIITFLLFLIRSRLNIFVIPLFVRHHTLSNSTVHGKVVDALTHQPIAQAAVAILDTTTKEVMTTTLTNRQGIFYFQNKHIQNGSNISILANGYSPNEYTLNEDVLPAEFSLHHDAVGGPLHNPFIQTILNFLSLFFEAFLVLSFLLEIFFVKTVGVIGIVFVGISLFNLFLWMLYQKERLRF